MMKKFLWLTTSILLLLLIGFLLYNFMFKTESLEGKNNNALSDNRHSKQMPGESDQQPSKESQTSTTKTLIKQIITHAKKGRVPSFDITVGKVNLQDIQAEWGNADKKDQTSVGLYLVYDEKQMTLGLDEESNLVDLRSYKLKLHTIHLEDIKEVMGNPDEVRQYKDDTHHQDILVYNLNSNYQLKWIVNQTTQELDHISIVLLKDPGVTVSNLIQDMTLEEKIGQMMIVGVEGTSLNKHNLLLIKDYHVGGVILFSENIGSATQTVNFINQLKKTANDDVPFFISVDQEGGLVARLPNTILNTPSNAEIGRVGQAEVARRVGEVLGEELRAFGFNMNFAPVVDVAYYDSSVIGSRAYGSNINRVSQLGVAEMKGIRSEGVISVVKHFPGYGRVTVDAHKDLPTVNVSSKELSKSDWIPYKKAIEEGTDAIMVTHILMPQIDQNYPASLSPVIIEKMLRNQLDFKGVIISDDLTMGAIMKHWAIEEAAVQAVQAGNDIILIGHGYERATAAIQAIKKAVNNGEIPMDRINASVTRILQMKNEYSITNKPVAPVNVEQINSKIRALLNKHF